MSKVTRLFDAASRSRYAREHPTTPTGVLFTWGGPTFNLLPLTFGELLDVTDIVDRAQAVIKDLFTQQDSLTRGEVTATGVDLITELLQIVANRAPLLIYKFRDHLAKSPGVCDSGTKDENAADRQQFEQWFLEQDAVAMLKAFFPKLKEVVAMRPLATPTPASPAAAPSSEPTIPTTSTS